MPRRQLVLSPRPSLTASSAVLSGSNAKTVPMSYNVGAQQSWQQECYRHFRICGEARFAATFFGHALSKCSLDVVASPTDSTVITAGPAYDLLQDLFNKSEGQAAVMSAIGLHFTIAGECYLIGRNTETPDPDAVYVEGQGTDDYDLWEIRSILEVKRVGTNWKIHPGSGQADIDLTDADTVIRLWTPDPAYALQADSPFRSLLPILEQIEWLTRYTFAQISSRLAGAGLLVVPEEMDFPPPPDTATDNRGTLDAPSKSDQLMATLAGAMLKPISDPSSPAAKIPVVLTAPADTIGAMKWINFWTELDTQAMAMRREAIERFALGMDLPPERILGMSSSGGGKGGNSNGVSHWGAWQIDEDTVKMHIEPMLDVVAGAITVSYIRKVTGDLSTIGYDTTALRLRPDRSVESLQLYDRGLVKGEVAVVENGFKVEDMMDPTERALWLTVKVAVGSATPDMVSEALSKLGVTLPVGTGNNNAGSPPPSLDSMPLPRSAPDPATSSLIAACEGLVFRALERAGNRLRSRGTKPPGLPSYETHTVFTSSQAQSKQLLDDAWPCAVQVLEGVSDHTKVVPVLDAYVTSLLTSGKPHTREAMAVWLEKL